MLQALILYYLQTFIPYLFFISLTLFKSVIRNCKSNLVNRFWITIVQVIIVKISIIKVYDSKTYIIANKPGNIRAYIIKACIIIRKYSIIKFLNHTFLESYIYQSNIQYKSFFENNFITQFLSRILIRNRIK